MKKLGAAASVLSIAGLLFATGAFTQPGPNSERSGASSQIRPLTTPPGEQMGEKTGPDARSMPPSAKELYASSLIGTSVRDPRGQSIGKVEELVIDPQDARVKQAVVSVGGFLGIGAKSIAIPWSEVKPAPDGDALIIARGKEELDKAPSWQKPEEEAKRTTTSPSTPPLGPTPGTPRRPQY